MKPETFVHWIFKLNTKFLASYPLKIHIQATQHAEYIALRTILESRRDLDPSQLVLYVTVEPCVMCAYAMLLGRVKHVFFGARNDRFGGCGSVLPIHNGTMNRTNHDESKEIKTISSFLIIKKSRLIQSYMGWTVSMVWWLTRPCSCWETFTMAKTQTVRKSNRPPKKFTLFINIEIFISKKSREYLTRITPLLFIKTMKMQQKRGRSNPLKQTMAQTRRAEQTRLD